MPFSPNDQQHELAIYLIDAFQLTNPEAFIDLWRQNQSVIGSETPALEVLSDLRARGWINVNQVYGSLEGEEASVSIQVSHQGSVQHRRLMHANKCALAAFEAIRACSPVSECENVAD